MDSLVGRSAHGRGAPRSPQRFDVSGLLFARSATPFHERVPRGQQPMTGRNRDASDSLILVGCPASPLMDHAGATNGAVEHVGAGRRR